MSAHKIAPASTSSYSSHSIPHDCTHLRAIERCDRVGSSATLGTNASQNSWLTNGCLRVLASAALPVDSGFRGGRAAETLGTLAGHRTHPKIMKANAEESTVNFLNGRIHRHQTRTGTETAALAGPLGGFEYVGSSRVDSDLDLAPADYAALESRWIDPEMRGAPESAEWPRSLAAKLSVAWGGGDYSGISHSLLPPELQPSVRLPPSPRSFGPRIRCRG